jgi:hypothetical protein
MAAIVAGVSAGLMGLWILAGYVPTRGIETPAYTIIDKHDGYEVREYAPQIRAEVTLEGEYGGTLNAGFRQLADYIFGNNTGKAPISMTAPVLAEKSEKIAMTAPVLSEKGAAQSRTISFVMPKKYTIESLPKPNNAKVALREVPAKRFAVLKFSGYASEKRAAKKTAQLMDALRRDGVKTANEPVVAQYNPPWTPPFMRRNEIQAPLQ